MLERLIDLEECILDGISGPFLVAQHPQREPVDPTLVALDQDPERLVIAAPGALDRLGVARPGDPRLRLAWLRRSPTVAYSPGCRAQCASLQVRPTPTSTSSGTRSSKTDSMISRTRAETDSTWCSGASKTSSSCTWRIMSASRPASRSAASTRTIAVLIRSAAVPWITVFTAMRSAAERCTRLREPRSGR